MKGAVLGQTTDPYCCTDQLRSTVLYICVVAICTQKLSSATYQAFCSFGRASRFISAFTSPLMGFFHVLQAQIRSRVSNQFRAYNNSIYYLYGIYEALLIHVENLGISERLKF